MHQILRLCGHGVWGLANVFANRKLYFTCDVPEANCLPQGLEPPAKPASKAAEPSAKPSTKSAAKPVAQVASKPAAGEPIPVAPVEHVQLFRLHCSPKTPARKSWTKSLSIATGSFWVILLFICPCVCMFCFVSRVPCVPSGGRVGRGGGGASLWVCSPGGVRIPLCTGDYYSSEGGWG